MSNKAELYTRAKVYVNSVLLAEETSVTVARTTNSVPMKSVQKGYSGETPGSPMLELTVESNVPNSGFELAPSNMSDLGFVEVIVELDNGSILPFEAFIYSDNFAHSVDSQSTFSASMRAKAVSWQ